MHFGDLRVSRQNVHGDTGGVMVVGWVGDLQRSDSIYSNYLVHLVRAQRNKEKKKRSEKRITNHSRAKIHYVIEEIEIGRGGGDCL